MYLTNFWQPIIHVQQNIFEKILIEVDSSNIYASFGSFCVQIGYLFETQYDFDFSEEFEIGGIFLRKQRFFKDSLHCASKNGPIWTQKVPNEA